MNDSCSWPAPRTQRHVSRLGRLQAEAKKLAFYLFYNIKGETARNHLVEEDLAAFLTPELAREAFQMLDADGNDKVNLHVSNLGLRAHAIAVYQRCARLLCCTELPRFICCGIWRGVTGDSETSLGKCTLYRRYGSLMAHPGA